MPRTSIAALIPAPDWEPWLEVRSSTIQVFKEVHPVLLRASILLLWDKYTIKRKHISILHLWRIFFNVKKPKGKIGIMCNTYTPGSQCISLDLNEKYSLDKMIHKLESADQRPKYPNPPENDALDIVNRAITSHQENNFRTALSKLRQAIITWEEDLFILRHKDVYGHEDFDPIKKEKAMKDISEALLQAEEIWEFNHCYFKLMPQYLDLLHWPKIQQHIRNAITTFTEEDWHNQKLSRLLSEYLEDTISYITEFYHMEPYEKPKKKK